MKSLFQSCHWRKDSLVKLIVLIFLSEGKYPAEEKKKKKTGECSTRTNQGTTSETQRLIYSSLIFWKNNKNKW